MNDFFNWIADRFREPSTWAGLGAVASGVSLFTGNQTVGAVAGALTDAGPTIANHGVTGAIVSIAGIVAMIMKDR